MRATIAVIASILLVALLPGVADAKGTFQKGRMSYSVSGSWQTTNVAQDRCDVSTGPGTVDNREFSYPVIEKGTFSARKGVAGYQGVVGKTPFFLGGDRAAKLSVSVTRTATKPVRCVDEPKNDCGTRTLKGVARSEFEGPFRAGRPLDLHLSFGDSKTAFDLSDPFKTCGTDATSLFLNRISGTTAQPDVQDQALRYPTTKAFWRHKRLSVAGAAKGKGYELRLRIKASRKTLVSKRDLHP